MASTGRKVKEDWRKAPRKISVREHILEEGGGKILGIVGSTFLRH